MKKKLNLYLAKNSHQLKFYGNTYDLLESLLVELEKGSSYKIILPILKQLYNIKQKAEATKSSLPSSIQDILAFLFPQNIVILITEFKNGFGDLVFTQKLVQSLIEKKKFPNGTQFCITTHMTPETKIISANKIFTETILYSPQFLYALFLIQYPLKNLAIFLCPSLNITLNFLNKIIMDSGCNSRSTLATHLLKHLEQPNNLFFIRHLKSQPACPIFIMTEYNEDEESAMCFNLMLKEVNVKSTILPTGLSRISEPKLGVFLPHASPTPVDHFSSLSVFSKKLLSKQRHYFHPQRATTPWLAYFGCDSLSSSNSLLAITSMHMEAASYADNLFFLILISKAFFNNVNDESQLLLIVSPNIELSTYIFRALNKNLPIPQQVLAAYNRIDIIDKDNEHSSIIGTHTSGVLTIQVLPAIPHHDFKKLLWLCRDSLALTGDQMVSDAMATPFTLPFYQVRPWKLYFWQAISETITDLIKSSSSCPQKQKIMLDLLPYLMISNTQDFSCHCEYMQVDRFKIPAMHDLASVKDEWTTTMRLFRERVYETHNLAHAIPQKFI